MLQTNPNRMNTLELRPSKTSSILYCDKNEQQYLILSFFGAVLFVNTSLFPLRRVVLLLMICITWF